MSRKTFLLLIVGTLCAGSAADLAAGQLSKDDRTYSHEVSPDPSYDEDPHAGGPPLTEDLSEVFTDSVEYIDPYLCPDTCSGDPEQCEEPEATAKALELNAQPAAGAGQEQSPLNLYLRAGTRLAPGVTVLLNYQNVHTWDVVETDGKVKFHLRPRRDGWDPAVRIGGVTYALKEFHCHQAAEHHLRGDTLPDFFECHYVHLDCSNNKAAVAIFLRKPPDANPPVLAGAAAVDFAPGWYVPCFGGRYLYWGSLTTPNFDEGVAWTVPSSQYKPADAETRRLFRWKSLGVRPLQQPNQRQIVRQWP